MTTAARTWKFQLYIAGHTPHADLALRRLRDALDEHLPEGYRLDVVDLREHPEMAVAEDIIMTPVVIRRSPTPERRLAGSFSDVAAVAAALGFASDGREGGPAPRG